MKLFAVLLIASLCATAWSASPIAIREIAESQAKVQELNAKVNPALSVAKGKIESFVKALGQNKEKILAKIDELKTKIQGVNEKIVINSSISRVQQLIRKGMKARLQRALERLDKLRSKILKLQ
ncbi:hypothetical protein GE061_011390 [Apolygus lucorum]|uniref:Uncharacterized protein n=1 Tax=Apolygus lucorum TaxID=248454 RepID=A0A6A4K4Z0_APOLU|nr:hypothetical protein GE061_011390 [Apolygus lucorum]